VVLHAVVSVHANELHAAQLAGMKRQVEAAAASGAPVIGRQGVAALLLQASVIAAQLYLQQLACVAHAAAGMGTFGNGKKFPNKNPEILIGGIIQTY